METNKKLYACWNQRENSLVFHLLTDEEADDVDMNGSWLGMIEVESEKLFHEKYEWNDEYKDFDEKTKI